MGFIKKRFFVYFFCS